METTLLTKENAHRVTMVRRVDAPESEPVAFLFRGKRHGYCSYSHLVGNPGKEEILAPADFKDWEVVEVAHPGYLEEYFKQACSSYNLTSFSPDERGESDIASHEKELHEDLQSMPEQQRERYMENYKRYFSAMIAANSRCASAMITGITGWAQVTGYRGETKELWQMEGRVQRDVWYLEHWTFLLDLYIIYKTIRNAIQGEKEAY